MKIFIDIGHPAHVHYFRYFIEIMKEKGHSIYVTARDKEVVLALLNFYKIPYHNRGKGRKGLWGKLLYIFEGGFILLKKALKFKPDLFLSFASPYAAHAAWLMRKPHIAFDDTDHSFFEHLVGMPFTTTIVTPKSYMKDFGKKHIRFDGFMELCSLHPKRYSSGSMNNPETAPKKYIILRLVSWNASHDINLQGLSLNDKYALVKKLSEYAEVLISSESPLPENLSQYAFKTHPASMHEFLAGASLIISESLTMAAEAAFLGTPALCISTATAGTLNEEVKLGLIELFRTSEGLLERGLEILEDDTYNENFRTKALGIVRNKVDVTSFMVWLVENYPESFRQLQSDPEYQLNFI